MLCGAGALGEDARVPEPMLVLLSGRIRRSRLRAWRTDYAEHHPHTSMGDQTSEKFEAAWRLSRTAKDGIF